MKDAAALHRDAMDIADDAWVRRQEGDFVGYTERIKGAYQAERTAAEMMLSAGAAEPTRSVLLRSAASLALECGETRQAEKLVSIALAGDPPPEIAEELRDIVEQVGLHRHLDTRGMVLHPNQIQVALSGNSVGFGVAESGVFIQRVRDLESLFFRTAERWVKKPFRERGRRNTQISKEMELFVVAPRPGSFTVSLQVGRQEQLGFEGFGFAEGVIGELLDCLSLFQSGSSRELEARIADEAYLLNFVGLARNIAPDGDAVKAVAFSTGGPRKDRELLLTRPRHTVQLVPKTVIGTVTSVSVQGILKLADATESRHEIGLIDSNARKHRVVVPEGMMDDIVRPLWDVEVKVTGEKRGSAIYLNDIRPIGYLTGPSESKLEKDDEES
jgi:hypothetical protein